MILFFNIQTVKLREDTGFIRMRHIKILELQRIEIMKELLQGLQ